MPEFTRLSRLFGVTIAENGNIRMSRPLGRITRRIAVEVRAGGVVFRVGDTGVGIPQEHLPRIFARFYRVEKSRSREGGGSGVGLAICRALVEAMGGTIRAESAGPDRGTTFVFSLPVLA